MTRHAQQHGSDGRFMAAAAASVTDEAPEPQVAPPKPFTTPVLRVQKEDYRAWIAAGGTPPIYGTFTVSGGIITSTGGQV
jgi:hypothetical protein